MELPEIIRKENAALLKIGDEQRQDQQSPPEMLLEDALFVQIGVELFDRIDKTLMRGLSWPIASFCRLRVVP